MVAETSHPYDYGYDPRDTLREMMEGEKGLVGMANRWRRRRRRGRRGPKGRMRRMARMRRMRGPKGRMRRMRRMRGRQQQWPPRYRPFEGSVRYPGQEFPGEIPPEQYVSESDEMAFTPEGELETMMGYGLTAEELRRKILRRSRRFRMASVIEPAITQGAAPLLRWPGPPPTPIATFPQPWPPARLITARIGSVRPPPALFKYGTVRRPRGRIIGREGSVAAPMPNPISYPMQWEAWRRRYPRKAARWMRINRGMYLRHQQALRAMRRQRRGGPQAQPVRLIRQQGPVQMRGRRLTRFDPTRPGLESGMAVAPEEVADIAAEGEEAAMMEMDAGMDPRMQRLLLFGGLGVVALVGFAAMRKGKKKTKKSAA